MNMELIREYCLQKMGSEESFPFGGDTLVFKVGGKVFLLCDLNRGNSFNVKCDPDKAIYLRERHTDIIPGFHMNKIHWNTIFIDGNLPDSLIVQLIDHSYDLVSRNIPKSVIRKIVAKK